MMSSLSGATLPGKMLSRRSYGKTIRELVEGFCPRDQDFQEVFGKNKTAEEVQAMIAAAKVRALSEGRFHVAIEDIYAMAYPTLRHRIFLNFKAMADHIDTDDLIREILKKVK